MLLEIVILSERTLGWLYVWKLTLANELSCVVWSKVESLFWVMKFYFSSTSLIESSLMLDLNYNREKFRRKKLKSCDWIFGFKSYNITCEILQ